MNTKLIQAALRHAAARSLKNKGGMYCDFSVIPYTALGTSAFNTAYSFETERDSLLDTQTDAETNCLFLLLVAEAISE